MKRAGLLSCKKKSFALLAISALTFFGIPTSAEAAYSGSAPCVQTIDTVVGVSVYQEGNSCFVAFKSNITYLWTPPTGISNIDLLIVAGGGGGGSRHAGGGGAGGLINSTGTSINTTALTITVGGGGAGGAATGSTGNEGSNGINSLVSGGGITTKTAYGGGGGAYNLTSGSGGSSGGGGCCGQALGTNTSGQGSLGASGFQNGIMYAGGGGGGAGAAGTAANASGGGSGGTGLAIAWISTAAQSNLVVGQNVSSQTYFAGGGGGSTNNSGAAGSGANGGGGNGANSAANGTAGTANTGGGGGGAGMNGGGAYKGGDGGSGVVVIRYSIPSLTSSATSTIAENTSTSTNAATVTVSESSTLTIRSVYDYTFFTIVFSDSVTARLRFINSPDYEAFADGGGNGIYDVGIRATNSSGNYQEFTISITVTDVLEAAVVAAPTISGAIYKGYSATISIVVNTPGKVGFLIADKRIPRCLAVSTTGAYPNYTASCTFKPSISGSRLIKGTLTPTNVGISAVTSAGKSVFIGNRTNTR